MNKTDIQQKIDGKTKPLGALGRLEQLALQICTVQNTLTPALQQPSILVFAADHGIAEENVSAYPSVVTQQMVYNFLAGGAAINVLARQHQLHLQIIDAGVNHDFAPHPHLIDAKIAYGTRNFLYEPAMTAAQCEAALQKGSELVSALQAEGCNVIGLGEMGIGNTSAAAVLMQVLTGLPLSICVGSGTGLDETGIAHKRAILTAAIAYHALPPDPVLSVLQTFGGFEVAMMVGAYCRAAEAGMLILVDGFIASAAVLVAARLQPDLDVLSHCIFTHQSAEMGHRRLLNYLRADVLLNLDMRLGEGSGIAVAYPLVESAVRFLNEMASFESAGVAERVS